METIAAACSLLADPAEFAAVRNELVVAQSIQFCEAAWGHAPRRADPRASDGKIEARVVQVLADGVKDETAA